MTTSGLPRILRRQGDLEPPTFLELFFDLVFIFTFRRLAQGLAENFSVTGVLRTTVLLLAVWWIWELTVWLTDLYDPRLPHVQFLVIIIMFGSLVMAVAVPTAFASHGWVLVVSYLGVIFIRAAFLIYGTRGHATQARSIRVAFWFGLTTGPWLTGALVPDATARLGLWALAVSLDYLAAGIGWPTPRLGRTRSESRIFTGVHVSERHRQIFIIGIGELILTGGLRFTVAGFGLRQWVTLIVTFAAAVLLFLIYSYQARRLLAPTTLRSIDRIDRGILTAYSHLLLVASVVLISSVGGFIAHSPSAALRTPEAIAIAAGPALFMLGSGLWEYAVTDRILRTRLIAFALLVVVAPVAGFLPAIAVAVGADLVLAGTLVADGLIQRRHPWRGPETSL